MLGFQSFLKKFVFFVNIFHSVEFHFEHAGNHFLLRFGQHCNVHAERIFVGITDISRAF